MNQVAFQIRITDVIDEYNKKVDALPGAIKAYERACTDLKTAATVFGTWGNTDIDTGRGVHESKLKSSLLKSAWQHIYDGLQIERLATAKDKSKFKQFLENPPEFDLHAIRSVFGDYVKDPRANILRGLAEVFGGLDPYYKSHEKMKIGVKGLPKRVIISNINDYGYGWGADKIKDVLNALASYQDKPLVSQQEINLLLKDEEALLKPQDIEGYNKTFTVPGRGVRLRRFKNGNGHLYFEPDALKDINSALSEYYGEVLPDCPEEKPKKKQESTAVSKDLQYYPTPQSVIDWVFADIYSIEGQKVLEPSCGCGRFLDALRLKGAKVFGIEYDAVRAMECQAKGHNVLIANFLETEPQPMYDWVIMNPPFYGKHYAKHVNHAMKFLKPGGTLKAVLPITARYDHGLLDGRWQDLPVGSFKESGTNINTTILTMFA